MAATIEAIQATIEVADAYSFMLMDALLAEQKKSCNNSCDTSLIETIIELTYMLERRVSENLLDDTTDDLLACLQSNLIGYSGSAGTVDPNASIPGTTIVVEGGGTTLPEQVYSPSDLEDDGGGGFSLTLSSIPEGFAPDVAVCEYAVGDPYFVYAVTGDGMSFTGFPNNTMLNITVKFR